jgi:hypothetical protein
VLIGANAAEMEKRIAAQMAMVEAEGTDGKAWLETRRSRWILGTPDQARAAATTFAEAGAERLMLQDLLPRDLDMIELAAAELIGRV